MKSLKKTILFTGAGGSGTIFLIKNLRSKYRIIVADMNKYSAGLYLAHKGYILPPCVDNNYLPSLDQIIKKEKVDVIVPLIDEELLSIRKFYQNKEKPKVLLPQEKFIELCLNKWNLMNALAKKGISCPKTYLLESFERFPKSLLPFIIKPITGRGSRGVKIIKAQGDWENYFKENSYKKEELIIQEFLSGTEFTISVVVSQSGKVLSVVPKEVIFKKGITKVAVTRANKKIDALCRKVQKQFQADGPFNVQLIIDAKDGRARVFEINPRFSTTVVLTSQAGVDEVGWLIEDLFGRTPKKFLPGFQEDLLMIRYEEQIFLPEKELKR